MIIIYNGQVVDSRHSYLGYVVVDGDRIATVGKGEPRMGLDAEYVDARGGYIMPGVIDDQVHFRDPGLTYKGDMQTESRAAIAGGVTSFMDMPNTNPQTTTAERLEQKFERAAAVSPANYSFFFGATNDNLREISKVDPRRTPGVKVFMGSSTGSMLVDRMSALEGIFSESPVLVATHCEDEGIVQKNIAAYGSSATIFDHPVIRSAEACYRSSALAVEIASKYNTRLHILHLSTERELSLFETRPLAEKRITNEVCVHHLWFCDADYARKGNFIKWNPAIKTAEDRAALRAGLENGRVDIVATDHAPHTLQEKQRDYLTAPSGGPLVQHSLTAMMEMFPATHVADYMAHRPAECFHIVDRGYLREGYFADIVIVDKERWTVAPENILYKCGWSPFDGDSFSHRVARTMVNGHWVYVDGVVDDGHKGMPLEFKI